PCAAPSPPPLRVLERNPAARECAVPWLTLERRAGRARLHGRTVCLSLVRRRVAGRERLARALVHRDTVLVGAVHRRGGTVAGNRLRAGAAGQELAQHVLQDAAVPVVLHLLRR